MTDTLQSRGVPCPQCEGSGEATRSTFDKRVIVCPRCNSTGYQPCDSCGGSKEVLLSYEYEAEQMQAEAHCPDCQLDGVPTGVKLR